MKVERGILKDMKGKRQRREERVRLNERAGITTSYVNGVLGEPRGNKQKKKSTVFLAKLLQPLYLYSAKMYRHVYSVWLGGMCLSIIDNEEND